MSMRRTTRYVCCLVFVCSSYIVFASLVNRVRSVARCFLFISLSHCLNCLFFILWNMIYYFSQDGGTALFHACLKGHTEIVRDMLSLKGVQTSLQTKVRMMLFVFVGMLIKWEDSFCC